MRVTPSAPALRRCSIRAAAVAAAGALLAGCSEDGSLPEFGDARETVEDAAEGAQEDAQEAAEDAVGDAADDAAEQAQETAEDAVEDLADGAGDEGAAEDEDDGGFWETITSWFGSDDEDEDDAEDGRDEDGAEEDGEAAEGEDPAEEAAEEEEAAEDEDDGGFWETITSWFGSDDEDEDDAEDGRDEDGAEEQETAAYGFPASCAEAGAAEAGGDLVPFGAQVQEDSGQIEQMPDAQYLSCVWETPEESFTVVYTENADPSGLVNLAGETGEQEMNWEVDVDVDVENYRSTEADALGGDLDYSATTEGSTQIIHLSLPENFYIAAVSVDQDASQQDLERVVYDAADRL